jgi:formate hydrogenlyase transcriptional activator
MVAQGSTVKIGDEEYLLGVAVDVSPLKQVEEELRGALAEIQELKGRLELENAYLRQEITVNHRHEGFVGESKAIRQVLNQVEQVAGTRSTVLVLGETGVGKELVAHAIHRLSPRHGRPLVKVNCAGLPSGLVESELFGREKGAYTGALTRQAGRFEVADKSTIFLDEIGELPLELQAKLLRVLQDGQFERLGSGTTIKVDVRVIAATNRDLAKEVRAGRFREDLYYRMNVFPIQVPPLRERRDDIASLVWAFVRELEATMGKRIESIPRKALEALVGHSWPGNVRELRNVIERAMIVSSGPVLSVEIPASVASVSAENAGSPMLEDVERRHIVAVLERTRWRVRGPGGAAGVLGLKPTTLESRMARLGIKRPPDVAGPV